MDTLLNTLCVVVTAHSRWLGTEWAGHNHRDNWTRLYYVERGEAWVRHHGRLFRLRPDRLHLIPARCVFSYGCTARFIQHWTHFNLMLHGGLELFDCVPCRYEVALSDRRRTLSLLARLEQVGNSTRLAGALEAKGLVLQLVAPFLEVGGAGVSPKSRLQALSGVLSYIDAHLDQRLEVASLARQAHLERTYFSKVFAQYTGLSPARFIQRRRVDLARQLLLTDDLSLAAVAEQLGFVDAFHFSKVFKRHIGVPPSQFRLRRQMP